MRPLPLLSLAATAANSVLALAPKDLDVNDAGKHTPTSLVDNVHIVDSPDSVKGVAKNLATNLMGYYRSQPETTVKGFPPILGVWVSGLVWSTLIDYQHYTGDDTFNGEVTAALTNEELLGANNDFLYDRNVSFRATDDVANLGLAALTAAERNFPPPSSDVASSWLTLAENSFKYLSGLRDDEICGGGIPWQIDSGNSPVYVSTLGTGAVFQLAARLARLTGDEDGSYANFASQLWDWTVEVGFITEDFDVVDGASAITNCQNINRAQFTQSSGLYLLGAAALANVTGDQQWTDRTKDLAARIAESFFVGGGDDGGVMVEIACEAAQTCPSDMQAMKGGLATALWRATQMAPFLDDLLRPLLETSAKAAAASCTFGKSEEDCPIIWDADITGINNSLTGPGQQVSVLAVVQGLLMSSADAPYTGDDSSGDSQGSSDKGNTEGDDDSGTVSVRVSTAFALGSLALASLIIF